MDTHNLVILALAKELKIAAVNEAVGDVVRIANVIENLVTSSGGSVYLNTCEQNARTFLKNNKIEE